ncbi:hypothetical protein [Streptomyces inhibens]|uniref:hypothetical protein n=1 Tax=Streptomyces inhibens TaxID=2293571 RepID=UPI001EE71A7C|nr:hypothetical protein [Streptomyces inhibens]UKY54938.1 hypothetical protein KI385_43435 [Streptomyces inhibens]
MRVGITGHRGLDQDVERQVRGLLDDAVREWEPAELVAVSCIADGPDSWFAEAVLKHGGHLEVVVPAREYRSGLPSWHHPTYDALLRQAVDVHETGLTTSDSAAHMAGSEILVGLAGQLLAVWDGKPARSHGGTADVVAYAERTGTPVQVVWPQGATRG